jgi:oligopeptidase B
MLTSKRALLAALIAFLSLGAADRQTAPTPPIAAVEPKRLEANGDVRVDPYYWLAKRDDPRAIRYLEAENQYAEAVMAPLQPLETEVLAEMKGRIPKDDSSAPVRRGGYFYYTRFAGDGEYPLFARKKGSLDAPEELLVDGNELASGHSYFSIAGVEESSGENLLAFATDVVGRRIYTLRFKDLSTGKMLADQIPDVTGDHSWAEDGKTIFYTKQDPGTLRSYRVYRHVIGTDPESDPLVFEESDPEFEVSVGKTRSRRFVMIESRQSLSSEVRYVDAAHPDQPFQVLLAREPNHEYDVDHLGDWFFIRTNWNATNFRLMRTPVASTGKESWQEVVPGRADVFLEDFEVFRDDLVLDERHDGLNRLRVRPWRDGQPAAATSTETIDGSSLPAVEHEIEFDEPAYTAGIGENPEVDSKTLRFYYSSMTTPVSAYDYDLVSRERVLRKRDVVLGGFDPSLYATERLWATARDRARVPISLVYRKDLKRPGGNPLLLYGYGSYGISMDAGFDPDRLSLLDRGFVYAIAHIRGGQELGRAWYENGKLQHKMNTFTDFIDCAEHLAATGWADRSRMFAAGGSAGGLLIGAVINLRPDLFRGAVARVPFVDVVTTMLDDSIPLTTGEFDEWGDPKKPDAYRYMLSYSPYDNVKAVDYPNLLVTAGLHDSQVQYFEPAKWVAKLRATKTDDHRLLLVTQMEAGHSGASGRFRHRNETALIYAFLIDLARPDASG